MHQAHILSRGSLVLFVAIILLQGVAHATGPFNTKVWSPDGRYIAFASSDEPLVVYDTQSNNSIELPGASAGGIPQFVSNTRLVLPSLKVSRGASVVDVVSGDIQELSIEIYENLWCASSDGKYIYAVTVPQYEPQVTRKGQPYTKEPRRILKTSIENPKEWEILAEFPNDYLLFDELSLSPDDTRLMFLKQYSAPGADSLGEKLLILDLATRETTEIMDNNNYTFSLDSVFWIDDQRIAYVEVAGEVDSRICTLYVHNLKTGQRTKWAEHLKQYQQPSLSPDGKSVWFRYLTMPEKENYMPLAPKHINPGSPLALARVNTDTGEIQTLPETQFYIHDAYESPDGQQLVYWEAGYYDDHLTLVFVCDLNTQEEEIIWATKGLEPIKEAYALQQQGDTHGAIRSYEKLVDSAEGKGHSKRVLNTCMDLLMSLYLRMEPPQVERVFDLKGVNYLHQELWRPEDVLATDPADDSMVRYGDKFSYPYTDIGRDVSKLSMRIGDEHLYFHLEHPSNRLDALEKYRSIAVLFDYDSPEEGQKIIFPNTHWERGAERILYFHEGQNFLITDTERIIAHGEVNQPDSPFFVVASYNNPTPAYSCLNPSLGPDPDWGGGLVFAVSRDILGLTEEQIVQIQVCTIKRFPEGRVENRYERSLVFEKNGKPVFNAADAFGETNTEERVNGEIAAGKLPVVEGFAAEVVLPAYKMTKGYAAEALLPANEMKEDYLAEILLPAYQREKDARIVAFLRVRTYMLLLVLPMLCIVGAYCIRRSNRELTRMETNSRMRT